MKKKKDVLLMILATVVAMLAMSVNVWAAQKNPLAKMPTKMKVTLGCSIGNVTNYSTPVYYNPPVYNFINDRLVDESAVLRPLSWHLILYVFRYFSRKWQKISDCECPDLIQNETPVRFLYGTQKNVRSDRAESSWHSN